MNDQLDHYEFMNLSFSLFERSNEPNRRGHFALGNCTLELIRRNFLNKIRFNQGRIEPYNSLLYKLGTIP